MPRAVADEDESIVSSRRSRVIRATSSDKENLPASAAKARRGPNTHHPPRGNGGGLQELNTSQALHHQVLETEGDRSVYDPDQSVEERRAVRRGYRNLQRTLDENKSEFLQPNNDGLLNTFRQANELFKNVKQTSDATLDSRLLVAASDLTLKKISNFAVGTSGVGIDVDEFVSKCIAFMKSASRRQQQQQHDDNSDDAINWAYLGRAAAFKGNKRPATSDFLLGPLAVQKKIRVQKARKQGLGRRRGEKATQPVEVDAKDIKQSENNALKLVKEVYDILCQYFQEYEIEDDGVPLFNIVLNPQSFAQSVENIFFVSFLVKEGRVAILDTDEGIPHLAVSDPVDDEQRNTDDIKRKQMIFSITMWEWKELIEVFDIKESIIPTREKEAANISATGWYT